MWTYCMRINMPSADKKWLPQSFHKYKYTLQYRHTVSTLILATATANYTELSNTMWKTLFTRPAIASCELLCTNGSAGAASVFSGRMVLCQGRRMSGKMVRNIAPFTSTAPIGGKVYYISRRSISSGISDVSDGSDGSRESGTSGAFDEEVASKVGAEQSYRVDARRNKETNSFHTVLPFVYSPKNHLYRAMKAMRNGVRFVENPNNKNDLKAKKTYVSKSFDRVMKELTVPLTNYVKVYSHFMDALHPFEATVAKLTMISREKTGKPKLDDILSRILDLRNTTSLVAKQYAKDVNSKKNSKEITDHFDEGILKLERLFITGSDEFDNSNTSNAAANSSNNNSNNSNSSINNSVNNNVNATPTVLSKCLEDLMDLQKAFRSVPAINVSHPSVVFVGCPNVGKSSIIRSISSGKPEVNNYPFTTRGITVGHIAFDDVKGVSIQVMDTPGLLDRPPEERNEMELLTYASMLHLPSAVVFVLDPTGLAGPQSSLDKQLRVRQYLKSRFPNRPWIDVVSKCDLLYTLGGVPFEDANASTSTSTSTTSTTTSSERESSAAAALEGLGLPLASFIEHSFPAGHLKVSMKSGMNKLELQAKIKEIVKELAKKFPLHKED